MGKTTVVLDENLLEDAREAIGARTKKETIETALREIVKKRQRDLLRKEMGTYKLNLTQEDLDKMRSDD